MFRQRRQEQLKLGAAVTQWIENGNRFYITECEKHRKFSPYAGLTVVLGYYSQNRNKVYSKRKLELVDYLYNKYKMSRKSIPPGYDPISQCCEVGFHEGFKYFVERGFEPFDSARMNFDDACEGGSLEIVKDMMNMCDDEKRFELISDTEYHNIFWSFREGHYPVFFYLCYLVNMSQKDLLECMKFLYDDENYVKYITLINAFFHRPKYDDCPLFEPKLLFMAFDYL